jgi:hypothetical protein
MATQKFDVAIVGAGAAGVAAAATAKNTARVILIDAADRLGGVVTAAMHRCMCGLYAAAPKHPLDTLNDGMQRKIISRMLSHDHAAVLVRQFGKTWVLEFPTAAWEKTLGEACVGVELMLRTRITAVRREGKHLLALRMNNGDWIEAAMIVDCSGGGSLLAMAGDDAVQAADASTSVAGYAVRCAGLSGDGEMMRLEVPYVLSRAVERGELPATARLTVFYPGPGPGEGVCKFAVDADDQMTSIRAFGEEIVRCLALGVRGFADARIIEQSPAPLRREGRRLAGKFIISEDDISIGRKHGGAAVHAWWPMERWSAQAGPRYEYPPPGEYYDIPAEALQSAVIENLFAAGACLSATAGAAASTRASGICLATGGLAGNLAAEQARTR